MIQVVKTGYIDENKSFLISPVRGEILKIIVVTARPLPTVKVKLTTNDREVLCDDYLEEDYTKFYPKNLAKVSHEHSFPENYIVFGSLSLEVSGLGDGEGISEVRVYYK